MVAWPDISTTRQPRIDLADGSEHLEAGDAGHPQVEQHQIGGPPPQLLHRLRAVDRRGDVEPLGLGDGADQRQNRAVVVDDEQLWPLACM